MKDYSQLRKAAERAVPGTNVYASVALGSMASQVLDLIVEVESLRGCDTAYAEVWEKARALQSEMDEVRKDADRYRWLIENAEEIYVDNQNLHLDPHYWGKEKVKIEADKIVDAGMIKDSGHD